jgi:hypothetical protein
LATWREQNQRTVAAAVRQYLQGRHPGGATLDVVQPEIRKEEFWWYVPIRPSTEPTKRYGYYEILADVESELEEKEHLRALLTPLPAEVERVPVG